MSMREDEPGDPARSEAEELAWRAIVDNYGDRPDLPEEPKPEPEPIELTLDDDESFVPPPLPPPAVISPERRVAWVGLVASPLLLVAVNLLDYSLPGILSVGLVIAFIASFGYLVASMSPRDPDDDGARL